MKTKIYSIMAGALLSGAISACDGGGFDNGSLSSDEGTLALSEIALEVNNAEKVISTPGTRADYDVSEFIVDIIKSNGATQASYVYKNMPDVVALPVGKYSVQVRSHNQAKAEWDKAYFTGSADFEIVKNKVTHDVEVTCSFAAIKVTTVFADGLLDKLSDLNILVIANDHSLTFTKDDVNRAAYFAAVPGSNTMVMEFSATYEGQPVTSRRVLDDIKVGQHRQFTFSVAHTPDVPDGEGSMEFENGDGFLNISYDDQDLIGAGVSTDDEILDSSDRPGQEGDDNTDPETPVTPPGDDDEEAIQFNAGELDLTKPNPVEEGKEYKVEIHAEKGISHLWVKIDSDNVDFLGSAGEMLPLEFDLTAISNSEEYPDLVAQMRDPETLGFGCNEDILGKTDVPFDITNLVPLLMNFDGKHWFNIKVIDAENNEKEVTLTFIVEDQE